MNKKPNKLRIESDFATNQSINKGSKRKIKFPTVTEYHQEMAVFTALKRI